MDLICLNWPTILSCGDICLQLQSRHQQAILEMNNQLEAEVSAIQNNLHQRARELERQVNSRVKKIEIAEKRKKKK